MVEKAGMGRLRAPTRGMERGAGRRGFSWYAVEANLWLVFHSGLFVSLKDLKGSPSLVWGIDWLRV